MAKHKEPKPSDGSEKAGSGKHRRADPLPQRKGAKDTPQIPSDPYRPVGTGAEHDRRVTCFGCGEASCTCTKIKRPK